MAIEIKAPTYPESVQEGTLATWHKNVGDSVTRDELLVDIETDKVVLEVVAPVTGVLTKVLKAEGDIILSNEIIATIDEVARSTTPSVQQEQADVQVADSLVNPAAKKRADELGIDLTEITGTG
jgi:2-oxoglutarate dehydrogenase E2 component (dihydrolipoamide succinyltransferase)